MIGLESVVGKAVQKGSKAKIAPKRVEDFMVFVV